MEKGAVSINEEAVRRDEQFDGLHGVWTSLDGEKHSAEEVYRHYGELWRIEESFRVMKHTMAVRPVFSLDAAAGAGSRGHLLCGVCDASDTALEA